MRGPPNIVCEETDLRGLPIVSEETDLRGPPYSLRRNLSKGTLHMVSAEIDLKGPPYSVRNRSEGAPYITNEETDLREAPI